MQLSFLIVPQRRPEVVPRSSLLSDAAGRTLGADRVGRRRHATVQPLQALAAARGAGAAAEEPAAGAIPTN